MANLDNFFIVSSVDLPLFNNKALDRFIVISESSKIKPVIIINKCDLDPDGAIDDYVDLYKELGYTIFKFSAVTGEGKEEVLKLTKGKKNLFWGHSGVGKSSILNLLYPVLQLSTGSISTYNYKGKHTTVIVNMVEVDKDTFVVDTPGIREIEPFGITKEDLGHYFVEFEPYIYDCRFNTCTHFHEPGCAVVEAVENDEIDQERYESYLRMLESLEEFKL